MKLKLNRPIAFFDLETTHKDPLKARIIELGIIIVHPKGDKEQYHYLCNPGENISDDNAAIHGFTNDKVKDWPPFKEVAQAAAEILTGCDFGGFNSNQYDIPLLAEEFNRAGVLFNFANADFVDVGVLFKQLAPRTLTAAVLTYLNKDHAGAHGAIADTVATIDVLEAMIIKHAGEIAATVPELALKSNYDMRRLDLAGKFKYRADGVEVFTFGKHKDEPLVQNISYLKWMLTARNQDNTDFSFSQDTRNTIERYLSGQMTVENIPKTMIGGSFSPPRGAK
jgi:DNA polymerase-3 subunit epsilon